MNSGDFLSKLSALGWSQAEFCRRAGVDQDTARRWVTLDRTQDWVDGFLSARLAIAEAYRANVEVKRRGR